MSLAVKLALPFPVLINQWGSRLGAKEEVENQQEKEEGAAVIH
jgi:hypothetical protein